jgi:hypothetical protein
MPIDEMLGDLPEGAYAEPVIEKPKKIEDFLGILTFKLKSAFHISFVSDKDMVIKTLPYEFVNKTCKEFMNHMLGKSSKNDICFNEKLGEQRESLALSKSILEGMDFFPSHCNYVVRGCVGTKPYIKRRLEMDDTIEVAHHYQHIGLNPTKVPVIELEFVMENYNANR